MILLSRRLLLADASNAVQVLKALEWRPLEIAKIKSEFTADELEDMRHNASRDGTTSQAVEKGAIGEYGLRKYLKRCGIDVIQNTTHKTRQYYFDWSGRDLGLVDVKGQRWKSRDIVLIGRGANWTPFCGHASKVDLLLTFALVGEDGIPSEAPTCLVPLAIVDVNAFSELARPLDIGVPGVAVDLKQAHLRGFLFPLNTKWWSEVTHAPV